MTVKLTSQKVERIELNDPSGGVWIPLSVIFQNRFD
jgi:hypothetical protein